MHRVANRVWYTFDMKRACGSKHLRDLPHLEKALSFDELPRAHRTFFHQVGDFPAAGYANMLSERLYGESRAVCYDPVPLTELQARNHCREGPCYVLMDLPFLSFMDLERQRRTLIRPSAIERSGSAALQLRPIVLESREAAPP